jgi:hypothetical protein
VQPAERARADEDIADERQTVSLVRPARADYADALGDSRKRIGRALDERQAAEHEARLVRAHPARRPAREYESFEIGHQINEVTFQGPRANLTSDKRERQK